MEASVKRVRFVVPFSAEWAVAWDGLKALGYLVPGDCYGRCPACNPESGECWEYMGTYPDGTGMAEHHQFRHRDYPGRGRLLVNVEVL